MWVAQVRPSKTAKVGCWCQAVAWIAWPRHLRYSWTTPTLGLASGARPACASNSVIYLNSRWPSLLLFTRMCCQDHNRWPWAPEATVHALHDLRRNCAQPETCKLKDIEARASRASTVGNCRLRVAKLVPNPHLGQSARR